MSDPSKVATFSAFDFEAHFIELIEKYLEGTLEPRQTDVLISYALGYFASGQRSCGPESMAQTLLGLGFQVDYDRRASKVLDFLRKFLKDGAESYFVSVKGKEPMSAPQPAMVECADDSKAVIQDWIASPVGLVADAMAQEGLETLISVCDVQDPDHPDAPAERIALLLHRVTDPEQIDAIASSSSSAPRLGNVPKIES